MNDMYFCPRTKSRDYFFIIGKPVIGCSISEVRLDHLNCLSRQNHSGPIKVSIRDSKNDMWTRWNEISQQNDYLMEMAYEIHRTLCDNEILIESDYPEYVDNVWAAKFIGKMLEDRGYIPHFYFSGSKSIHAHIFFDFDYLLTADNELLKSIGKLHINEDDFLKKFILYLRELMISSWNTEAKEFDKNLINPKHLIRSEMSLNKLGFKTFLGYDYHKLEETPIICNTASTIYPEIATACIPNGEIQHELKLSRPHNLNSILKEYISYRHQKIAEEKIQKRKWARQMKANKRFISEKKLRPMVEFILSDKFLEKQDGFKRGMFILANELCRIHEKEEVQKILYDWNLRMGNPIPKEQMDYRINNKTEYKFSNKYIQEFLKGIGFSESFI